MRIEATGTVAPPRQRPSALSSASMACNCARTVHESIIFKQIEDKLSEKQIPRCVGNVVGVESRAPMAGARAPGCWSRTLTFRPMRNGRQKWGLRFGAEYS
jgi:hypothetical protein